MNSAKLAVTFSMLLAGSALVACSSDRTGEGVGATEQHATQDIDSMKKRPDGAFDVTCSDGSQQVATADDLKTDNVCIPKAAASSCIAPVTPPKAAWKAPAASLQVCNPADLQALSDAAQTAGTWQEIVDAVALQNAACASCIFTPAESPNWGPIVLTDGGQNGFVNWSACFARAPGATDACGEAFFQQNECGIGMCQSCGDQESLVGCYGEATGDVTKCGQYDVETACNGFAAVDAACPNVFASIGFNCGGM